MAVKVFLSPHHRKLVFGKNFRGKCLLPGIFFEKGPREEGGPI
jgi:hypothetical protein